MATTIRNKELEHEQDIKDWINDIRRMKEELKKLRLLYSCCTIRLNNSVIKNKLKKIVRTYG
jgi:hypothetical protein